MTENKLVSLSRQIEGLVVDGLTRPGPDALDLRFTNGMVLVLHATDRGIKAVLRKPRVRGTGSKAGSAPTRRQREYLEFIRKYTHRFGYPPAESDIQRRFLVSAPSVNQMVRTLERRGFIERGRDRMGRTVPRSIRVIWDG